MATATDKEASTRPAKGNRRWAPADDLQPVTPDDNNDNIFDTDDTTPIVANGFEVGVSGTVTVITAAGKTRTIPAVNLPPGKVVPCRIKRVLAAGTTASGILAYTNPL